MTASQILGRPLSPMSDTNIGADAWTRTGALTFNRNPKVKQKVTYGRIQQHLQERYQATFSYGMVVQLCVARLKWRRSSANYKYAWLRLLLVELERVGFDLRYNPDRHWSGACIDS